MSIVEKECLEHEEAHLLSIKRHKRKLLIRRYAKPLFAKSIVYGTWKDWGKLYALYVEFISQESPRDPSLMRHVLSSSAQLRLMLKRLFWEQTKEGRPFRRSGSLCQMSPGNSIVWEALEQSSTEPKKVGDFREYLIEKKRILGNLSLMLRTIPSDLSPVFTPLEKVLAATNKTMDAIDLSLKAFE